MPRVEFDDEGIRRLVAHLLPEEGMRTACVRVFASAIRTADSYNHSLWGVTPYPDRLRLVVGGLVACTLHLGSIWVALSKDDYTRDAEKKLTAARTWTPDAVSYNAISVVTGYYTPTNAAPAPTEEVIRSLNAAFIGQVAEKWQRLNARSQKAHSQPAMRYLREVSHENLPEPRYR